MSNTITICPKLNKIRIQFLFLFAWHEERVRRIDTLHLFGTTNENRLNLWWKFPEHNTANATFIKYLHERGSFSTNNPNQKTKESNHTLQKCTEIEHQNETLRCDSVIYAIETFRYLVQIYRIHGKIIVIDIDCAIVFLNAYVNVYIYSKCVT